ncbi:MAG: hypothetical protein IKH11_05470, partial [Bacteroidales bacterium]|nr:hypothetical protein [Bacteroidales bacterium]
QDTGKTKYRLINPAVDPTYTLVGWYVVDEKDKTTSTPYDFGSEVENPVKIRAVWNLGGDYGLFYNPSVTVTVKPAEGETPAVTRDVTGTVTQNSDRYADGAEVVIGAPPTDITNGFVFDGWEVVEPDTPDGPGKVLDDNGGNYYQPGQDLKLNAALWARNRTIFLRAHYTPIDSSDQPIGVTYLQFQPNFPEGAVNPTGAATAVKYYALNSAIDLASDTFVPKSPADYSCAGYKLIGWSQDPNAVPVVNHDPENGPLVFGLKDVVGVDGLDVVVDMFYDDPETAEDEHRAVKGNILYAIWDYQYYYVYHSASCKVQRFQMPTAANATFKITELVTNGFLYGGYYQNYSGKSENFAISKISADKWADNTYEDVGGTRYEGKVGVWSSSDQYTESGLMVKPVADRVYYLKEVPADKYLQPYLHYAYRTETKEIRTSWLISNIDDNNYVESGFIITDAQGKGTVVKSLTVNYASNGSHIKLTPRRVYGVKGVTDGYLTYGKVLDYKDDKLEKYCGFDENCTVTQYWVT